MEIENFGIVFLNESLSFFPGDKIAGHVTFGLPKPTFVEKVEVLIKGFYHVNWDKAITAASPTTVPTKTPEQPSKNDTFYKPLKNSKRFIAKKHTKKHLRNQNSLKQSISTPALFAESQKFNKISLNSSKTSICSEFLSSNSSSTSTSTSFTPLNMPFLQKNLKDCQHYLNQTVLLFHYRKQNKRSSLDSTSEKSSDLPFLSQDSFSSTGSQQSHNFQAGSYNLPFSIQLPNRLPNSFVGDYGVLRYLVVALLTVSPCPVSISDNIINKRKKFNRKKVLDGRIDSCSSGYSSSGSWAFKTSLDEEPNNDKNKSSLSSLVAEKCSLQEETNDLTYEKSCREEKKVVRSVREFKVAANTIVPKHHLEAKNIEIKEKQMILFFKMGHIKGFWKLNKTGFLAGETMKIDGNFENNGKIVVKRTKVTLVQTIEYGSSTCKNSNITQRKKLLCKSKAAILPNSSGFWRELLVIPPQTPTNTDDNAPIKIRYNLKLLIEFSRFFKAIQNEVEIFIGNSHSSPVETTEKQEHNEYTNYFT